MKSLKFNIRPISCLGRPLRKVLFILGPLRGVPSSIRGFFERLMNYLELGYARNYIIEAYSNGIIDRDEMLRQMDEVEQRLLYNYNKR